MILIAVGSRVRRDWQMQLQKRLRITGTPKLRADPDGIAIEAGMSGRPLFSPDDALMTLLLVHLFPVARLKSPQTWPSETLKIFRNLYRYFGNELTAFDSQIPGSYVDLTGKTMEELRVELFAAFLLEKVEVLATWLGRLEVPRLRLEGQARLQEALDAGHGAVLWCEVCSSASLMIKAAFAQAGFQIHHLSRPAHNISNTRFGIRYLNAIVRQAEDRYLAERILVYEGNELSVSRHIMGCLAANGVVSITVGNVGSQVVRSHALHGVVSVATGAPHFALRSGAPLLPVFSHRDGDEHVVEIGEPIRLEGMDRQEANQFAVDQFARQMETYARSYPFDWSGWLRGSYTESGSAAG